MVCYDNVEGANGSLGWLQSEDNSIETGHTGAGTASGKSVTTSSFLSYLHFLMCFKLQSASKNGLFNSPFLGARTAAVVCNLAVPS